MLLQKGICRLLKMISILKKQKPAIKNDMYLFIIGKIAYATVEYSS